MPYCNKNMRLAYAYSQDSVQYSEGRLATSSWVNNLFKSLELEAAAISKFDE